MRLILAIILFCVATSRVQAAPPNIVLIVSDDQGYNDLGCLNDEVISPNLDRIVREGVRLTNFYVAWPACTPSRGAFLTGRYPQRNGIYDMIRNEAPDYGHKYTPQEYAVTWERIGGMDLLEELFPQFLQKAGYRCGIFGKWDLGMSRRFLPTQRGFDEFYGFVNTGIDYFTHERYGVPSMYRNNSPTEDDKGTYCTDLFRREAERFLAEHHEHPFLLYLPFNAPHSASSLDPKIRSAAQGPEKYKKLFPHLEDSYRESTKYGKPALVATSSKRRLEYLAAIASMDAAIGSVLDLLDHYQIADNTIVIFFSDNGGSGGADNSPLRGHKSQMFEGGIRVCAAVRGPGLPAGTVCDEFLTSLELLPTLMHLTPADADQDIIVDGFNMWPVLQGTEPSPRKSMFWKRREKEAARIGNWKWIRNSSGEFLFNLEQDTSEQNNLAKQNPQKTKEMAQAFHTWLSEMEAAEPRGPFRDY